MNDTQLVHLADDIRTGREHIENILGNGSPDPGDARKLKVIDNLLAMAAKQVNGLMCCPAVTFGVGTRCELPPHGDDVDHRNGELRWTTQSQADLAKQWGF